MSDPEVGNVLYRSVLPRTYRVGDDVWVKIQSSIRGPAQGLVIAALEDMHLRLNPTAVHLRDRWRSAALSLGLIPFGAPHGVGGRSKPSTPKDEDGEDWARPRLSIQLGPGTCERAG